MGLKDFWRGWHEEEQRKDRKLIKALQNLGIYEQNDFEAIRDEVNEALKQSEVAGAIRANPDIAESYTKKEQGIKAFAEIEQWYDHGTNQDDINKAIERLARKTNDSRRKERLARKFIEHCVSRGYYGYLLLRKWLSIPLEHPKLRPWYAKFLPLIPNLINPGGEVILLEGTYNISDSITIAKSNVSLRGVGAASVLFLPNGTNKPLIQIGDGSTTYENIAVSRLMLDGNGSNQSEDFWCDLKILSKVKNISIMDNDFKNAWRYSCGTPTNATEVEKIVFSNNRIDHGGVDFWAKNIIANDNILIDALHLDHASGGINISKAEGDYVVCGNLVVDSWYDGIAIDGPKTTGHTWRGVIADNVIINAADDGIEPVHNVKYVIVADNIVIDASQHPTGGGYSYGIKYAHQYDNNYPCKMALIIDNVVYDDQTEKTMRSAIWVGTESESCIIIGNYVNTGTSGNSIEVDSSAQSSTIIRNNKGYNPVGVSSITVGSSPFTYTAGMSPETVYIRGGTVSDISVGGTTIFTDTGHWVDLEPHQSVVITYSDAPTMTKYVH